MIRRRATAGLSLLCALVFCAFAAQSASAKGTTAFTCEPVTGEPAAGFEDEHCDKATTVKAKIKFVHKEIAVGTETPVTITNEKTTNETKGAAHVRLTGEAALTKLQITCKEVNGTGTITNKLVGGVMHSVGTNITLNFLNCPVEKPENCTVEEPIVVKVSSETRENLGAGKNEMGVEFKPTGANLAEVKFLGEKCALTNGGKPFPLAGTLIATAPGGGGEAAASSATLEITEAMSKETLKFAGKAAELFGVLTFRMKAEGTNPTNPISLTTTAT